MLDDICGADNWTEIESFGRQKQAWLETFLELPHGIPSHDTLGTSSVCWTPPQLEACFVTWVRSLATPLRDRIVAVDGKAVRSSHDEARTVSLLHLVSAWAHGGAAGVTALRHSPAIRTFYERLCQRGKAKKVALVAAKRKQAGWNNGYLLKVLSNGRVSEVPGW
ncbi:MAG: ISAs1 family transposase [Caldilineaceae bacterium SB0666_bin_21]|nr:ISAs1 family transposase [Caldilineaceae bacterium SB0666_bin_21]